MDLLRRTVLENQFIPKFHPGFPSIPQATFLTLPCEELLYGGAAGGGKSAGMLAAALQYVDQPNYDALILRRTYQQLIKPGALMDMAKDWLAGKAYSLESGKIWRFPSGATLTFGHCANEMDKYDYQSAMWNFIGFDELSQFPESIYRYLFSRLRRLAGFPIPSRMRATANPGGDGSAWVRRRWIVPWQQHREERGCRFVPATLEDNPGIDREDYERMLLRLGPIEYQQLRYGNWDVLESGGVFSVEALAAMTKDIKPGRIGTVVDDHDDEEEAG